MRKWASVAIVLAALAYPHAALADTPPDVYSDFAADGVLSCGHSRSALKRVLNDASIYQYGDPLMFLQLKLAIRKQLESGCRRNERPLAFFGAPTGSRPTTPAPQSESSTKESPGGTKTQPGKTPPSSDPTGETEATEATSVEQNGRMVLLGVVLLLVTLGSGGWAARRAFTD